MTRVMYESFYGLRERPFDLTANPRYLFLTPVHREALSTLQYGLTSHKGVTLLVGEAGTGKTTILRAVLDIVRGANAWVVHISNPTLTRSEFFELLAAGFGLSASASTSKARFLAELESEALQRRRGGGLTALVIDEAQSLPGELMEEVRLLSNMETPTEKLLPIVLVGQPELADRLNTQPFRQMKQRIAIRTSLRPLDLRETAAYVAKRLRVAGGDCSTIFTRRAIEAVHARSRGIPRTISVVCDNALVTGFALERRPVDADIIAEVTGDLDLVDAGPAPTAGPWAMPASGPAPAAAAAAEIAPAAGTPPEPGRPPEREFFEVFNRRRRFLFF